VQGILGSATAVITEKARERVILFHFAKGAVWPTHVRKSARSSELIQSTSSPDSRAAPRQGNRAPARSFGGLVWKDKQAMVDVPEPRKGMPNPRLDEAEFKQRYSEQFRDPAFDPFRDALQDI
jgi:hypothetical protein